MKTSYDFRPTESWWLKDGKNFIVEVRHWKSRDALLSGKFDEAIENYWNVYVYVFPAHPYFNDLTDENFGNSPSLEELHYGATYVKWEFDADAKVSMKCYGSDYTHLHDEHFLNCDTCDHSAAREVFFDAERLFDSFKNAEDECSETDTAGVQ